MKAWIDRDPQYQIDAKPLQTLIDEAKKSGQLETLNWAMKCCAHGYTNGMLRTIFHNKFVEISGEGEKA